MKRTFVVGLLLLLAVPGFGASDGKVGMPYENIALGKRYTLFPPPNYPYCTDPEDKTQLTDGKYTDITKGQFWTQKSTVGWSNQGMPEMITLDLADDYPIRGLSYNTASGGGDVEWPASIEVLVGVDDRRYHFIGDLIALSKTKPPSGSNVVHRFQTDGLKVHGRYVKLIIHRTKFYTFVDEIEVFRGEEVWKKLPLPGKETRYPRDYYSPFLKSTIFIWSDDPFNAKIRYRIDADLEEARTAVVKAGLPSPIRERLMTEANTLQQAVGELPEYEAKGFRGTFPLNEIHARVYALHGLVRKAQGRAAIVVWQANPWDFLQPNELPAKTPAPRINVAVMRGETRAGAVNLTNCTGQSQLAQVTFEGLPGGATPTYVTVREVAWTDTFQRTPVAAALPVAKRDAKGWKISVPAGMTRQVWLEVTPVDLSAGNHAGEVLLKLPTREPLRVPFAIRVFDLGFPKEPTLHVSGWEYTDTDYYGVTDENREALIAHLRERYVDSPWAGPWTMPYGEFNADGTFKTAPNTSGFDAWIKRWPHARRYCVYNYVTSGSDEGKIDGTAIGDPLFAKKVATWIRFWVTHARNQGIDPSQLYLNLHDEPNQRGHDQVIIAWSKAIKAVEPNVAIWVDPNYKTPTDALPELWSTVDVICPNWGQLLSQGKKFEEFYRRQKQAGKRLDLYSCGGAKLLDPYAYYRLQAWSCFDLGAESSMFWAFGDSGGPGGSSWNEYALKYAPFSPLFISPNSVTAGKHMEAIRESVEDFEYLAMLRNRVQQLTRSGSTHPLLPRARTLLNGAPRRVLNAKVADKAEWKVSKDRTVADTVRIEIGEILEKLR